MTTKRRPRAGYRAIADHYRDAIAAGQLRPGDHLPTMREAMETWGVSIQTVVRAYRVLRLEGLTRSSTGAGTIVADAASPGLPDRVTRHAATGDALASGETSEILHVGEVDAPDAIASRLGVTPGDRVWMRRRRVSAHGEVSHVSTSYYTSRVVAATPELTRASSTGGSRELAAERLGSDQASVLEEAHPMIAGPSDAHDLGISVGDPLIRVVRTVWLRDDTVVEVAVKITHRPLRWTTPLDGSG